MFASVGRARVLQQANQRTLVDKMLLDLFLGGSSVLKSWRQRSALLGILEPHDRLRLLGLVRRPLWSPRLQGLGFWYMHTKGMARGLIRCSIKEECVGLASDLGQALLRTEPPGYSCDI